MVRQEEEDRALAFRASIERRAKARQARVQALVGNGDAARRIREGWEPILLARIESDSRQSNGEDGE